MKNSLLNTRYALHFNIKKKRFLFQFASDRFRGLSLCRCLWPVRKQPCILEVVVFSGVLPEDPQQIQGRDEGGFCCSGGANPIWWVVMFFRLSLEMFFFFLSFFFLVKLTQHSPWHNTFSFTWRLAWYLQWHLSVLVLHEVSVRISWVFQLFICPKDAENLRCCDSCSTRLGCPSDQVDSQWHKWRHRASIGWDFKVVSWWRPSWIYVGFNFENMHWIEFSWNHSLRASASNLLFCFVVKKLKMVCKRNFYFFVFFFVEAYFGKHECAGRVAIASHRCCGINSWHKHINRKLMMFMDFPEHALPRTETSLVGAHHWGNIPSYWGRYHCSSKQRTVIGTRCWQFAEALWSEYSDLDVARDWLWGNELWMWAVLQVHKSTVLYRFLGQKLSDVEFNKVFSIRAISTFSTKMYSCNWKRLIFEFFQVTKRLAWLRCNCWGSNFDASGSATWALGTKRIKLNHKFMVGVPAKRRTAGISGGTQEIRLTRSVLGKLNQTARQRNL